MKKLLLLFGFSLVFLVSCVQNRSDELTTEQIAKEKAKVLEVMKAYNLAYQKEKFSEIIETLSEDVVFFGTDSTEVIRSLSDFKKMIQAQWEKYDIKYGEMVDTWILMDNYGTLASMVFGVPAHVKMPDGTEQDVFFRISRTLKKQNQKWVIASGIVGITQVMPATAAKPQTTPPTNAK